MNKAALVTGGSRGIGLGIAQALAAEGCDLAVCGVRSEQEADAALARLRNSGTQILYVQADVADAQARARLLAAVRERFGRLDILINNAGIAPAERRDMLDSSEESFERVLRVNLQGPYFLTQAVAQWMIDQKRAAPGLAACIINVSSVSATAASTNRGEYCISKAGVAMATALWAVRLSEFGIPVYEVRPGIIRTDMTAAVQEKYDLLISEGILLQKRWGMPEDVGRAVAMLARGDLQYSTGQVIQVDGGFTVPRL